MTFLVVDILCDKLWIKKQCVGYRGHTVFLRRRGGTSQTLHVNLASEKSLKMVLGIYALLVFRLRHLQCSIGILRLEKDCRIRQILA